MKQNLYLFSSSLEFFAAASIHGVATVLDTESLVVNEFFCPMAQIVIVLTASVWI